MMEDKTPASKHKTASAPTLPVGSAEKKKVKKKRCKEKKKSSKVGRNSLSTPSTSEETVSAHKHGKSSKRHSHSASSNIEMPVSQGDTKKSPKPLDTSKKADENQDMGSGAFHSVDLLATSINETLRWDGVLEDPVAEEERIKLYKLKRQLRYLAAQKSACKDAQFCKQEFSNIQPQKENPYAISSKILQKLTTKDHSNSYFVGQRS